MKESQTEAAKAGARTSRTWALSTSHITISLGHAHFWALAWRWIGWLVILMPPLLPDARMAGWLAPRVSNVPGLSTLHFYPSHYICFTYTNTHTQPPNRTEANHTPCCVCVCVCVRAACVCVCVCVWSDMFSWYFFSSCKLA